MTAAEQWVLRFTSQHQEKFYLVRMGDKHGDITMVAETSPDITRARVFESYPEAAALIESARMPPGWDATVKP